MKKFTNLNAQDAVDFAGSVLVALLIVFSVDAVFGRDLGIHGICGVLVLMEWFESKIQGRPFFGISVDIKRDRK